MQNEMGKKDYKILEIRVILTRWIFAKNLDRYDTFSVFMIPDIVQSSLSNSEIIRNFVGNLENCKIFYK